MHADADIYLIFVKDRRTFKHELDMHVEFLEKKSILFDSSNVTYHTAFRFLSDNKIPACFTSDTNGTKVPGPLVRLEFIY